MEWNEVVRKLRFWGGFIVLCCRENPDPDAPDSIVGPMVHWSPDLADLQAYEAAFPGLCAPGSGCMPDGLYLAVYGLIDGQLCVKFYGDDMPAARANLLPEDCDGFEDGSIPGLPAGFWPMDMDGEG